MTQEYPPGSWGALMADLERRIDALPWFLRWYYRHRVRRARQKVQDGQRRAISRWLRS